MDRIDINHQFTIDDQKLIMNVAKTKTSMDFTERYKMNCIKDPKDGECKIPSPELVNTPLFITYIGLSNNRVDYKKEIYEFTSFISDAGGFVASMYKFFNFMTFILCSIKVNTKLI